MKGLVLLSGGLDSVAALHWAIETFDEVRALTFDYGQPSRQELDVAQRIALRREIDWACLHLGEAICGVDAQSVPKPGVDYAGVSRANLAARNAIFLSVAAAHACTVWPHADVALIIGANADDAMAFPDCRAQFLECMRDALWAATTGIASISICAPWLRFRKSRIIQWCEVESDDALNDVRESISCYGGSRCGTCDACTRRACAFEDCDVEDGPVNSMEQRA